MALRLRSGARPRLSSMISSIPTTVALRPRARRQFAWSQTRSADETLTLAPRGSGWQLVSDSGRVVYSAEGPDAHRQCLRRAYEHGVLYLR